VIDSTLVPFIAMTFLSIGSVSGINSVWKSRTNLRGFSKISTTFPLIGQSLNFIYLMMNNSYILALMTIFVIVYFIFASYYNLRRKK